MTAKRFNYTCEKIGQHWCIEISDNQTKEPFDVGYSEITDNYSQTKDNVKFIVELLNELHDENQIKLEIVDAFIRGLEDEKGIALEDKEFQCRMNHTIRVLQRLKEDMLNPTEFKRLKEL